MISKNLEQILTKVIEEATSQFHEYLTVEHLLLGVVNDGEGKSILDACGCDVREMKEGLEEHIKENVPVLPRSSVREPVATLSFQRVMDRLIQHIQFSGKTSAGPGDLLISILEEKESYAAYYFNSKGITKLDVMSYVSHGMPGSDEDGNEGQEYYEGEEDDEPPVKGDVLVKFATCLNDKAAKGEIDPLIGRRAEVSRAIVIMNRRRKNNLIFVGEPGVGKTAIVEGIALRIHQGRVPECLKDAKIYSIDISAMLAGTRYRGDFEARLKATVKSLEAIPNVIMFLDEIHNIIGAGSGSKSGPDAANMLKPALSSGKLRCIGTTTFEEFKNIESDRALLRRFEKVDLYEPDIAETYRILRGLRKVYEDFHGIKYSKSALKAAVELSAKYIDEKFLPDKAIDVLDEAAAIQKLRKSSHKIVLKRHIETAVAKIAKIPAKRITSSESEKLQYIDRDLKKVVFGQDSAIDSIVRSIKIARAGMKSNDKPVGSFLFTGPTGVGKTEVAKQLATLLGVNFLRFDMSEYMEKHAVSRFIGAPPGYVGFEQGGALTDSIKKHPYSVLLLDEIEKAHEDIFNILLQIMDHATLTDNTGKKADFKNVILIMTSNAGAREMAKGGIGFTHSIKDVEWKGKEAIEKLFTPEFRNRLDSIIPFNALGLESIKLVVNKFINEMNEQLKERKVILDISDSALTLLAEKGYDPVLGARPISRLIQREIKDKLAHEILFGSLKKGGIAKIGKADNSENLEINAIANVNNTPTSAD
ncbi:MAG: ATP-dependent Clp protease ATP-binding subunit ClpA [Candidatus Riflebacteria bacterium]|nr:ATP-dependent Clp protease ATP-binding subunit ClpA [Candidatus Riflebacteria bacterium]